MTGRVFVAAQVNTRCPRPALYVSGATGMPLPNAMQSGLGTAASTSSQNGGTADSTSFQASNSASNGKAPAGVPHGSTTINISVQGAHRTRTEWILALAQSEFKAPSPYKAQAWEEALERAGLSQRYPKIPGGLREGFSFNYIPITSTQIPPNKDSVIEFADVFQETVAAEISKGRYVGPFSQREVEIIFGPFQTSPFSIIPKPGKPGKFRLIQNLSFPYTTSRLYPNPSINAGVNSDDFPCTWGTFDTICLLISRLPPGSQAAVRDVAEAYRTIPLHRSQWPSTVVCIGKDKFCLDLNTCFGAAPAAGGYGHMGDAGVDLFRANGMGPVSKWVDDHIFFRILHAYRDDYNTQRQAWQEDISRRGPKQSGGRLWFGGHLFNDGTLEQFDEDCSFPCLNLSSSSVRPPEDKDFTYSMADIDRLSVSLGIPWETSKDIPFTTTPTFIGFIWDLRLLTVSLSPSKITKYLASIEAWSAAPTHTLQEIQALYGKLLHACLVYPVGRSRLTGLEVMLSTGRDRPFVPRHAPVAVRSELVWWTNQLRGNTTPCPIPQPVSLVELGTYQMQAPALELASLLVTDGELGGSFPVGKPPMVAETSDGQKLLDSNFWSDQSHPFSLLLSTTGSMEITKGSSRAGGMGEVETLPSTVFSSVSKNTSKTWMLPSTFIPNMSPVPRTLQTHLPEANTATQISCYPLLPSQQSYSRLSLSLTPRFLPQSSATTGVEHTQPQRPNTSPRPWMQLQPGVHSMSNDSSSSIMRSKQSEVMTARQQFLKDLTLPSRSSNKPRPYRIGLAIRSSPLRPHCLAADRLKLWLPFIFEYLHRIQNLVFTLQR